MAIALMMEAARTSETLVNFYQITALMMDTARTSETLVNFYQITRRYNPEENIFVLTAVRTSNRTQAILFVLRKIRSSIICTLHQILLG
jgi:hypothetical protein